MALPAESMSLSLQRCRAKRSNQPRLRIATPGRTLKR